MPISGIHHTCQQVTLSSVIYISFQPIKPVYISVSPLSTNTCFNYIQTYSFQGHYINYILSSLFQDHLLMQLLGSLDHVLMCVDNYLKSLHYA